MNQFTPFILGLALALALPACKQATPASPAPERKGSAATVADVAGDAAVTMTISRVVFLDQENCCDCTKERQDASWQVLQDVLAPLKAKPAVEVVHSDTAPDDAQMYADLKPTMVMPGLYFFDADEVMVDHLQGEVKAEQIAEILNR